MSARVARRVAGLKRTLIREIFESAPPDALNLGLGQPDLGAPDVLREALAAAARQGASGYGPTAGLNELRQAVAAEYGEWGAEGSDVLITAGCQQATFVALACLLDPGDELLVPDPGFPGAARAAEGLSAIPRRYPLDPERGFHLDVDEVMGLAGPRTRAVVVISPSNPTGTVEPAATLSRLQRQTSRAGLWLVLDDTYGGLCWSPAGGAPGLDPDEPLDHVVVCGGLSKSLALTGWRVGWAVTRNRELAPRLVAMQQTVLTCPSTPIQQGALAAFSDEGRKAARSIAARFRARRDLVGRHLEGLSHAPLEGAFYAWIRSGAASGRDLARRLLEREKIVVIPGIAFGDGGERWIRLSYAQRDDALERALPLVAAAIAP